MNNTNYPIKTSVVGLKEVLQGTYHIPDYQRPYEWDENNIDDFLSTILDGFKEIKEQKIDRKPVFFGTIQLNKENSNLSKLDIVDGQQRLTTFLLFLAVLQSKKDIVSGDHIDCKSVIDYQSIKDALDTSVSKIDLENNPPRYLANKKYLADKVVIYHQEFGCTDYFFNELYKFVLENVYFVRLDTEEMDLSDVVSVFNTINTTGLDLNASDIFKFRYYDYLHSKDQDDSWMAKINDCYRLIEEGNEQCRSLKRIDQSMIDMSWILDIYKHIICAQFGWGFTEVRKSNQQFFDDLFKSRKLASQTDFQVLDFDTFHTIVVEFIKYWRWIENAKYEDEHQDKALELFSVNLVEKSRYSRYWTIPFVIAYFKSDGKEWRDYYIDSLRVNLYMFRFFAIYSVINDKVINAVQNKVCDYCFELFRDKSINEMICGIKAILWDDIRGDGYSPKELFYDIIKQGLFSNGSRVHLICTLSALLDEINDLRNSYKYREGDKEIDIIISEKNIQERLFDWVNNPYDIEHILAQNSFKDEPEEDKKIYNGIGNLVVLDRAINRYIKDLDVSEKIDKYRYSKYVSVKHYLIPEIEKQKWDKEAVLKRQKTEISKIEEFMDW